MDGYTVEEAASVLGVPRERVWELIARGVLSAAPDLAGGMRVRLRADGPQPPQRAQQDVPAAEAAPVAGGQPFVDPSPFRELLTEFRGLTERYGQALLALGEARGEVAGLRSRVELLEARVDLRLPGGTPPAAQRWSTSPPAGAERVVPHEAERQAAPPAQREGDDGEPEEDRAAPHRRSGKGGRRATEAFAEALARADDPSAPELPGARDAAAAWAALRDAPQPAEAGTDAALPRELPAADDVPVADEQPPRQEATPSAEDGAEAAPETRIEATNGQSEHADEAGAAPDVADAESHVAEPVESPPVESPAAVSPPDAAEDQQLPAPPGGDARDEPQWVDDRYTAEIEEPGWFTAEELGLEPGSAPRMEPAPEPASAAPRAPEGPMAWPRTDTAPSAEGEARDASTHEAGSRQLDEGLAALDALAHPERVDAPASEPDAGRDGSSAEPQPAAGATEPDRSVEAVQPSPEPSHHDERSAAPWSPPAPERTSPASMRAGSRAYRRLRRIFPD